MSYAFLKYTALAFIGTSLVACASAPTVDVAEDAASADFVLRASGSGDWAVTCTETTQRGRVAYSSMDGRGGDDTGVIAKADVVSAECQYTAGDFPFSLSLEEGFTCPFGDFEDGVCRTQLAAQTSGEFSFLPE